jgi:hypothetical protein
MCTVINAEPCDKCAELYKECTLLVEMKRVFDTHAYGRNEKQPQPTGRWCAIRREALNIEPTPVAYVEPELMNQILEMVKGASQ